MAGRTRQADTIVDNSDTDALYTAIEPDTDTATGGGDTATDRGESADAGYGFFPDGRPRKRAPRQRRTTATAQPDSTPLHSRAQKRGLTKSIALSSEAAFNAIATIRTATLGFVPDPTSMTGLLLIPEKDENGKETGEMRPLGAGEVWILDKKSAMELGEAWADVIELYCPPELVHRSSVLTTAVVTTMMIVGTRVFGDIQMQESIKAARAIRGEGLPNMPQSPSPNGTPTDISAYMQTGKPDVQPESVE